MEEEGLIKAEKEGGAGFIGSRAENARNFSIFAKPKQSITQRRRRRRKGLFKANAVNEEDPERGGGGGERRSIQS